MTAPIAISRHVAGLPGTTTFGGGAPIAGIRFALTGGSPAPEALPAEGINAALQSTLARADARKVALNYSEAHGNIRLREWLGAYESVEPRRIVIANGALHGISLLARALLDPGDAVVVEDPTFAVAIRAFHYANADIHRIGLDGPGFVANLRHKLDAGLRPKIVYTIPDFQNPTGLVMPTDDRIELVRLAEQFGFVVLWDNPYREARVAGTQLPDITTDNAHVVKVNTFSKSLGPGLRLGWLVLPEFLIEPVLNIRRRTDQQAPTFMQNVVAEFLSVPSQFETTVATIRRLHAERLSALSESLRDHAADSLEFTQPEGGFFLWARLRDENIDPLILERAALSEGVLYVTGRQFGDAGQSDFSRYLRLGFTTLSPDELHEAGASLSRAIRRARAG